MAKTPTEISSLARSHSPGALKVLAGIMNSPKASDTARVAAANSILDRAWGKAVQKNENETTLRYVARVPDKAHTSEEWQQQHERPTLQ